MCNINAVETGACSLPQRIIPSTFMPALTGVNLDRLYEMVRVGAFPRPLKLGPRATGWLESDVIAWQRRLIAARDGKAA